MRNGGLGMAAAVALAAAGWQGAALADVSARAAITHLGYRLVDLRPEDGVAPAISFDLDYTRASQAVYAAEGLAPNGERPLRGLYGKGLSWVEPFQFFPREQRAVATPSAAASARMGGSLVAGSYSAVAEGHARNTLDNPDFVSRFAASSIASDSSLISDDTRAFSLTPYTQVIWSGHVVLEAASTLGKRGGRFEEASAGAFMEVYDAARQPLDLFERTLNVPRYRPTRLSERWDIELAFVNLGSDAPAYGFINTGVRVTGDSFLPVPEAGTSWLMLCGLGVLAAARRRRSPAATQPTGAAA